MRPKQWIKHAVPRGLHPPAFAERLLTRLKRSNHVRGGPFAGMQFTWEQWDKHYTIPLPKFLGTYELELHAIIERLLALAPRRIIEIGAADGFYVIGFARRLPQVEVIAFEELTAGQQFIRDLAAANGVADRVRVFGRCEIPELSTTLRGGEETVLMMDVEGFEDVLLDPPALPALTETTILVECHDCYAPGVTERIASRFATTHRQTRIATLPRTLRYLRTIDWFHKLYCRHNMLGWMGERLYPVTWLYLEPYRAGEKKVAVARS